MDNKDEFYWEETSEKIWCLKNDRWFETILLTKLPEIIKTPYCVVSEKDVSSYLNDKDDINIELYDSSNVSLVDPIDIISDEFVINVEEGIKILEEHGYKVVK